MRIEDMKNWTVDQLKNARKDSMKFWIYKNARLSWKEIVM